jgi:DNA-binding transcriptional ArsR family regulator
MGTEEISDAAAASAEPGARPVLPDHPVRVALLDLLAQEGGVTATEAAERLGYSSGLCSFHLRQLARHGLIEEAPHDGGRARPWRLRWGTPQPPATSTPPAPARTPASEPQPAPDLAPAPAPVPADCDTFSGVLRLTPRERRELAAAMRELIGSYGERAGRRAVGAEPVAVAYWMAPLTDRWTGGTRPADGRTVG